MANQHATQGDQHDGAEPYRADHRLMAAVGASHVGAPAGAPPDLEHVGDAAGRDRTLVDQLIAQEGATLWGMIIRIARKVGLSDREILEATQ